MSVLLNNLKYDKFVLKDTENKIHNFNSVKIDVLNVFVNRMYSRMINSEFGKIEHLLSNFEKNLLDNNISKSCLDDNLEYFIKEKHPPIISLSLDNTKIGEIQSPFTVLSFCSIENSVEKVTSDKLKIMIDQRIFDEMDTPLIDQVYAKEVDLTIYTGRDMDNHIYINDTEELSKIIKGIKFKI